MRTSHTAATRAAKGSPPSTNSRNMWSACTPRRNLIYASMWARALTFVRVWIIVRVEILSLLHFCWSLDFGQNVKFCQSWQFSQNMFFSSQSRKIWSELVKVGINRILNITKVAKQFQHPSKLRKLWKCTSAFYFSRYGCGYASANSSNLCKHMRIAHGHVAGMGKKARA